jgi:hypothetical protein
MTALARVASPSDPLTLDPNMTDQQTAEHLAVLFLLLFEIVNGNNDGVLVDWFYQLIKDYKKLNSPPRQVGASSAQLIERSSMKSRDKQTREIYLGMSADLESVIDMVT